MPDVNKACERFEKLGVEFVKKPDAGTMKGLAFIKVLHDANVYSSRCNSTLRMHHVCAGPRWLLDRNSEWPELPETGLVPVCTLYLWKDTLVNVSCSVFQAMPAVS